LLPKSPTAPVLFVTITESIIMIKFIRHTGSTDSVGTIVIDVGIICHQRLTVQLWWRLGELL